MRLFQKESPDIERATITIYERQDSEEGGWQW